MPDALKNPPKTGFWRHTESSIRSGFNWSLQHLDEEVVDGQASRVDEGVDGAFAYEVAGCNVASPRGPTGVLACDRNWSDERGGRRCGRRVSGSWKSMVQAWWRGASGRREPSAGARPARLSPAARAGVAASARRRVPIPKARATVPESPRRAACRPSRRTPIRAVYGGLVTCGESRRP